MTTTTTTTAATATDSRALRHPDDQPPVAVSTATLAVLAATYAPSLRDLLPAIEARRPVAHLLLAR